VRARLPLVIALVGLTAWLVVALLTWAGGAPLGHDESQYAIAAREALAGEPPRWFYLSRGMNIVAIPGLWLGGSVQALRFVPLLFGVGFVMAAYALGRRVATPLAAALAVVVLACSRNVVGMSADLLSDMPAAACLLVAVGLIAGELGRDDIVRWRIVAIGPLMAAAFYLRYGSVIPIAVIVGAAVLVASRKLFLRPLPALVAAALFLVCLIPHFLEANKLLGSVLGILRLSKEVPNEVNPESGLATYLTSNPFKFYGVITTLALLPGLASLHLGDRKKFFVWLVGVGSLIAMGLTAHGVFRYVLLPVACLVVLGTDQVVRWVEPVLAKRAQARRIVVAACVLALVVPWALMARRQFAVGDSREKRLQPMLTAAAAVKKDAAGSACVMIGYRYTQLEWYSGCFAPLILDPGAAKWGFEHARRVYLVRELGPGPVAKWDPGFGNMPGTPRDVFASKEVEVRELIAPK